MAEPTSDFLHMDENTVAAVEERSHARVFERLSDDAPCKGSDSVLCPFCDRPLRVRRTVLGYLDEVENGDRPHIDGVQMKCAGDDGCGFRPDFDVPMPRDEWEWEQSHRDEKLVDMGFSPDDGTTIQERLRSLGYLIE